MQWLPFLFVESTSWRLAVSDRSTAVLTRVLLDDNRADATDALADALQTDPPLAIWAVCRAKDSGSEPRDVASLAAWLAADPVGALGEASDAEAAEDPAPEAALNADSAPSHVDHVARSVAVAGLSATLAADDAMIHAEEAYLVGLLHEPATWALPSKAYAEVSPDLFLAALPSWIGSSRATVCVDRAARLLASEAPDAAWAERIRGQRDVGAKAASQWADTDPAGRIPLATLLARLGRLRTLETEFQKKLEAEKLESMAEFAAGAGHEINNPLAVIAGRAQLLLREETDPERRRTFALMNTQAKRVYEMIADMMLFARPPKPKFEQVELIGLIDHVVDDLRPGMTEQAVTLSRAGDNRLITIEADPTQLNVALRAMCRNALEAIGHDGRIEIDATESDDHAILRVADNGPGIAPETRRHLFDPYFSARQAGRGLGMGLSKCWRIVVTNHRGSIDVASSPGSETIFTLTLPKRQGP